VFRIAGASRSLEVSCRELFYLVPGAVREPPPVVGKASKELEVQFRGGTGYALDAAMHGSNNFVLVAAVPKEVCEAVEAELIWQGRWQLAYNKNGKISPPSQRWELVHEGTPPSFGRFDVAKPGKTCLTCMYSGVGGRSREASPLPVRPSWHYSLNSLLSKGELQI
jgi:hypothetical protein